MTRHMTGPDTRIVYGSMCCWWDVIAKVSTLQGGLPCCPTCRGLLFEVPDMAAWTVAAEKAEADGRPGYVDFITWMQGKCFKTMAIARDAYLVDTGKAVKI